jgi:MFS family permease
MLTGMTTRRRLRDVELVGTRKVIRQALFIATAALSAGGLISYLLPAHRLAGEDAFHSNCADGGPVPIVTFLCMAAFALFALRRRHGAGYLVGFGALGTGLAALLAVFLTHLFVAFERGVGEVFLPLAVFGLWLVGLLTLVAAPILYLGQRRQLERDVDPQFPAARVVPRGRELPGAGR